MTGRSSGDAPSAPIHVAQQPDRLLGGRAAAFVRRGPVSGVLSWTAIYLGSPLPAASSGRTRATAGQALIAPIRPCSGWGLPSRHVTVALVRSYRTVSACLPTCTGARGPRTVSGESSFLWHFPSRLRARPLACTLPCGAPTFLTSAAVKRRHARPSGPLRPRSLAPDGQAVSCRPCACSFAQVSFSVSVRLKTSAPGFESGSGQK